MKTYTKRQLHKARGIRTWYLRTYEDGRTTYTSLKTTSAKVAQEIVDRMNAARFFPELAQGFGGATSETDIAKAAREFLDQVSMLTPKSLDPYTVTVGWFRQYCKTKGIDTMEGFTKAEAAKFVEAQAASMKPNTIRNRTATISLFYKRTAQRQGIKLEDPFEDVRLPKIEKREKDFWTMDEIGKILDSAHTPSTRMSWALMGYAGLRINEAACLEAKDIQGDEMLVYGKGGKEVRLPISERLRAEIDRYVAACGGTYKATNVGKFYSSKALCRACDRAGVNRGNWCTNHKLRHSFSSNLARIGCPEKIAQTLMRHSSIAMTMDVYAHVIPDDVKKWSGKL